MALHINKIDGVYTIKGTITASQVHHLRAFFMCSFFAVNTHQNRATKKMKKISKEMIGNMLTPSICSKFPLTNFNMTTVLISGYFRFFLNFDIGTQTL